MDPADIDFAYKYPFAPQAKSVVAELNLNKIDHDLLKFGRIRVEEALNKGAIEYKSTPLLELKKTYLISYVYARMLVSSLGNKSYAGRYAIAEARRCASALKGDSDVALFKVCADLNIKARKKGDMFLIGFVAFASNVPKNSGISLSNQKLEGGEISLEKDELVKILEEAMFREIRKGLPIDIKAIPAEVADYAKSMKIIVPEIEIRGLHGKASDIRRYSWIEKLLSTPIGDVRHRTVNLILAPYLTNIRGMSAEAAAEVIVKYIDRCKEINPDTDVNASYISYQCRYAKSRSLKPMALERAADMLKGTINLDEK